MADADNRCVPMVELDDEGNVTRVVGCRCGWKIPAGASDPEYLWLMHGAARRLLSWFVWASGPCN